MAISISFTGGRPAMISAAAGSVALVIAPLAKTHSLDYVVAAVFLAGAIQIVLGLLGIAKLMRFIPRSVMVGFVNGLGVLMFLAQLPYLRDVPWTVYLLVGLGLACMLVLPRLSSAIPTPLVAIVAVAAVAWAAGWQVPVVADAGALPTGLPGLFMPQLPWTLDTLETIAPYALAVALVGLMESLLTAKVVDGITDVHSDKTRESLGQGAGNILSAIIGGMGVCAMIGQTMINVKTSGARTRMSTFLAGIFLLIFCIGLGEVVGQIPMAGLVAVMIVVSATTVNWHSVRPRTLRLMPLSETLCMAVTVIATVLTQNLALGVILGVVTATLSFAQKVAHIVRVEEVSPGFYKGLGQLFFASSNELVYCFDYRIAATTVIIDLSEAEVWDVSAVASLDSVRERYARHGVSVEFRGLDGPSLERLRRLSKAIGD